MDIQKIITVQKCNLADVIANITQNLQLFLYSFSLPFFYYFFSERQTWMLRNSTFSFFVLYLFTTPVMNEQARWKGERRCRGEIRQRWRGGERRGSFNAVAGEGIKNLERPEYQRLKPIRIEPKYGVLEYSEGSVVVLSNIRMT